jgi:queuine tRNA-ribosyltransferase
MKPTQATFLFEVIHQSTRSRARVGRIHTPHGIIETPNFVPVATHAALKSVDSLLAQHVPVDLMFCNTYHLMLHPGADVVAQAGGLHHFMKRPHPIITDSGGFQIFSLAYGGVHDELKSKGGSHTSTSVVKITEEGVHFRSYRDGTALFLTPESSIAAQKKLGADIILPLDKLTPYHISRENLAQSVELTHRWEERSLAAHRSQPTQQALYGILHGGTDPELRRQSAQHLTNLPFDGFAVGGSFGKNTHDLITMLGHLMPHVPAEFPIHLLGIGDLASIDAAMPYGIDTFDSSYPSRAARHGTIFTRSGVLKIERTQHRAELFPLDETCTCPVCTTHTRAYIHHLFKAHELSAYTLATIHNIAHFMNLMRDYRAAILEDKI